MSAPPSRHSLPDTLRAIAMLSVLVVNAMGYAVAPWGPILGVRTPPDSAVAAATQGLVAALLQGKGYAMLAFVFGMALWLATQGRGRAEALRRGRLRNRRLLQLGVAHGSLVYFGDILTLYALVSRWLLGRLSMPWRPLRGHLGRALLWAVLAKLVFVGVLVGTPDVQDGSDAWSLATVQGPWQFLQLNAASYAAGQAIAFVLAGPVVYLCMLSGVAAARLRLLTHRRWRSALRRCLLRWAPALLGLSAVYGAGYAVTEPWGLQRAWVDGLGELISVPVAACMVAALALASSGGSAGWCRWFRPLGQRTLTLYVGHSLVCLLLFSGAGLAWAPGSLQMLLICVGLWLAALAGAGCSGRRRWPLEAWMARR